MELLVVLVIIAVLAAAVIPSVLGYIDESKRQVCEINRMQVEREFHIWDVYYSSLGKTITLKEMFDGKVPEADKNVKAIVCPSGGKYSVEEAGTHITCSIPSHGGGTGGNTPEGGDFGGIPVVPSYWPTDADFDAAAADRLWVEPGGVFLHSDGNYYVVLKRIELTRAAAGAGPGNFNPNSDELAPVSETRYTADSLTADGQLPAAVRGDVFVDASGNAYVYIAGGGSPQIAYPPTHPWGANIWSRVPS